jgi:hypothetical protein
MIEVDKEDDTDQAILISSGAPGTEMSHMILHAAKKARNAPIVAYDPSRRAYLSRRKSRHIFRNVRGGRMMLDRRCTGSSRSRC